MPISITAGAPIRGYRAPSRSQRTDAGAVIALLQYADIWRGRGTLRSSGGARLDMQGSIPASGTTPARQNLQVQIGGTTFAHADVSTAIQAAAAGQPAALAAVVSALTQSLGSGNSYAVAGTNP